MTFIKSIAMDTFYLGKSIDRKHRLLRKLFDIFLVDLIFSVVGFIVCHVLCNDLFVYPCCMKVFSTGKGLVVKHVVIE
jgi:hypothetical protein